MDGLEGAKEQTMNCSWCFPLSVPLVRFRGSNSESNDSSPWYRTITARIASSYLLCCWVVQGLIQQLGSSSVSGVVSMNRAQSQLG